MKASRSTRNKPKRKSIKATQRESDFTSFLKTDKQPIVIFCLVAAVFLCYANSFANDFVFDDYALILTNPRIRTLNWGLVLDLYRPFRDLSYAIDYAIWGERPFGFHLTNILIHAANVLLVFALIRRLTEGLVTPALTALIFAIHPIQTDAVTYISGRRDLLFTFFYLSAFHCYLSYYRDRWSRFSILSFAGFLLLWACAMLSKEMAITLPLIVFVWHYCDAWKEEERVGWREGLRALRTAFMRERWLYIVLVLGGGFVAWCWVFIVGASKRVSSAGIKYWGGSFYANALTVARIHAWYLKQLVFPTPIAQYLGGFDISHSIFDWRVIVSLLVVASVLCLGWYLQTRARLISLAIFSYFVFLLPVSQIIPHHELLADHYLYLPMMSFGLFVSLSAAEISKSGRVAKTAPYYFVGAALLVLAVMTVFENRVWKDEYTLWSTNYQAVPNSPRAALNLGNSIQETEPQRAEELFKRALNLDPTPDIKEKAYDRLAVILIQEKKFDEAEFYVSDVLQRTPNDFFGNLWSAQIHIGRSECEKAKPPLLLAQAAASGQPREIVLFEETQRQFQEKCGR